MKLIPLLFTFGSVLAQYTIPSGYTNTFQVHSQFAAPGATASQAQTVLQFTFGTAGQTSTATLTPPTDTSFTAVSFTLQITGSGLQFDRLIHITLTTNGTGNGKYVEVWRSSTFEPTSTGVYSTFTKDMTGFISFLKTPQTLYVNMDNYVDSTYTGNFAVQVVATYYYGAKQIAVPPTAIYPATSGSAGWATITNGNNGLSLWDNSSVTVPRNTNKAIVNVFASGTYTGCGSTGSSDEFWWASSPGSDSSFREIQVYVDGKLAGVGWPFPILYTGGVNPGYWRPVVAINAYDAYALPVDVTPFLGILTDGNAHTISVTVKGIPANLDCGAGWHLGGRLDTWQSSATTPTTVTGFTSNVQPNASAVSGNNGNSQAFTRKHTTSATINGAAYTYSQSLSFSNTVSSAGAINQKTSGTDTTNGAANTYSWPITYNETHSLTSSLTQLYHEFHLSSLGINTAQIAKAISSGRTSYGTNQQTYTDGTGYSRTVKASMGSVISDSNPSKKRDLSGERRHSRDMGGVESRDLPPFLQNLLNGVVGQFFDGNLPMSPASLALCEAAIAAVGGFNPSIAPKQVQFAPSNKISAGPFFVR